MARESPSDRNLRLLAAAVGVTLTLIGIRFLFWPSAAGRTFGLSVQDLNPAAYAVIGLRDIWLGTMVAAFAWYRLWFAIAIWFAFATLVCFADAGIVAATTARPLPLAFHLASGVLCAGLAVAAFSRHR